MSSASSSRASSSSRYTVASAASTIGFVLTLCLPYTSASPLPSPDGATSDFSGAITQDVVGQGRGTNTWTHALTASNSSVMQGLSAVGHFAGSLLPRNVDAISTASLSTSHPSFGLARLDAEGYYRLPTSYVTLVQKFNPGFIVLSYAIAFVGSLCTLELLIRRTTNAGWRNQLLLASAGFTFGAVSTFAMHFIFNNSLSLHHPMQDRKSYPALRLAYDPGFTVLSLIVSCLAMTVAFFVMGTSFHDWWCVPGSRQRRQRRRSSTFSDVQKQGDDYGRWKDAHKKVLRRGTIGMGALLSRAGSAAKWSMMDSGAEKDDAAKWGGSAVKSKKGSADYDPSDPIRNDSKLAELDFRLGRSAVQRELAKRTEPTSPLTPTHQTPIAPITPIGPRTSFQSIRPMPSDASLPSEPSKTFYPPTRRGSVPEAVFTPGFNFPPRETDPASSTTYLLHTSPFNSVRTLDRSPLGWSEDESPLPDTSKRRASLPAVVLPPRIDPSLRQGQIPTLSRIQSLPEADPEMGLSRSPSLEDPTQSSKSSDDPKLGERTVTRDTHGSNKHVEFKGKPVFTTIEKFLGFDVVTRDEIIKIFITGTIAGMGVAAMHYIGQLSITGLPYIAYKAPYVVGSIIIASGAVVIALYIMFIMLRPKLKHTWISKIAVALILAIAVCAMHFCGMMGTIYAWPVGEGIVPSAMLVGTNKVITGIVAALAFVACIACCVFFTLHSLKLRREKARRRRVVVAAVFLDPLDRVLVNSTDGMLPMCDIANLSGNATGTLSSRRSLKSSTNMSWNSDSTVLGMDLTTGHDAFVSAMKMSWAWTNPSLAPPNSYAPTSEEAAASGTQTLAGTMGDIRRGSLQTMASSIATSKQVRLSVSKFLERFAQSSGKLATQLLGQQDGISRLGVLYDQILTTGWVKLNNSNDTVSKGQLIFLVRRVASAEERSDLLAKHFIFAESQAVAQALHKTLSVPVDHTVPLLEDIRTFCDSTLKPTLKPGIVYAGVAVVQATPFDGLRILLEQDHRAQLPMREVCSITSGLDSVAQDGLSGTAEELGEAIGWLEGMSLLSIIARNMSADTASLGGPRVKALLLALERAIVPMLDGMLDSEDMQHILPRLHIHPVLVPLTPGGVRRPSTPKIPGYTPPYIIVFYANYDAAVNTFTDKWLPFSLFRAQNACVMSSRIKAAARAEAVYNPQTISMIDSVATDDFEYSRRPSKVQFDFTDNTSPAASPGVNPTPALAGGMFGGFAFPPKAEGVPGGTPVSPGLAGLGATGAVAKRNVGAATIGRRSSLVARSRYGSDAALAMEKTGGSLGAGVGAGAAFGGEVLPGVAAWEPDWLLILLRTKLRAEA